MPKFRYKAVTAAGRRASGTLEATSLQRAKEMLQGEGLWITAITDTNESLLYRELTFGGKRVKTETFAVFCRQLATMYRAGVSLLEAIVILSEQTSSKAFKKVLLEVAEELRSGSQLSEAAAKHPAIFSTVFVHMVHAGEAAGNLDTMLNRLAVFYEKERNTVEKVKSAMVYPVIMLVLMVIVVIFLMLFVIPQYAASFAGMGIELPLPTRIVMAASDFMQQYWYTVILLLAAPWLGLKMVIRHEAGRLRVDRLKLSVPVFGKLWHKQALARFTRTFSSLTAAAVPLMQAVAIVSNVVGNAAIGNVIADMRESVLSGGRCRNR
ncbi:type II secretion system F family protein [Paenibacillus protaetiae]|uniref:type II secretion system F family protein n=1 Tax=Paenibacillus protaetiae TaxID=2509456 RepID=UPI001FC9E6BB|nr:type II secretion system F family protein [Paenibacillus protaetiae]